MKKDSTIWILLMGYLVTVMLLILLGLSCSRPEKHEDVSVVVVDSVVYKSQENLKQSEAVQHKSDSIIHVKIEKKVKEIRALNNLVSKLSEPRPAMIMIPDTIVEQKIEYRTDTVYVEIQKNFWGRKKMKMYRKVDSSFIEINPEDSTDNK